MARKTKNLPLLVDMGPTWIATHADIDLVERRAEITLRRKHDTHHLAFLSLDLARGIVDHFDAPVTHSNFQDGVSKILKLIQLVYD